MHRRVKIILRHDSESNWIQYNPVLHEGELVYSYYEDGTLIFKLGNGSSHYSDLDPVPLYDGILRGSIYCNGTLIGKIVPPVPLLTMSFEELIPKESEQI